MHALAAPMVAIVFGGFTLCAETCLHFADIVSPSHLTDLPFHDWLAGGLLIYGGVMARRDWRHGRPYQAAGWGFIASLLIGAFIGHLGEWASGQQQSDDWISEEA